MAASFSPDAMARAVSMLHAALIALPIVTFFALCLRLYTRWRYLTIRLDDYAIVAAWAVFLATCILALEFNDQVEHHGTFSVPLFSAGGALYVANMTLIKLSMGFFFLGIMAVPRSWQRYLIHFVTWSTVVFSIMFLVYQATSCGRTAPVMGGTTNVKACPSLYTYTDMLLAWSIYNVGGDYVLCAIAIFAIVKTHLSIAARISASLILALGTAGAVAGTVRLTLVTTPAQDFLHGIYIGLWTTIEPGCAILAICLLVLRPLFSNTLPGLKRSFGAGGSSSSGSNRKRPGMVMMSLKSWHPTGGSSIDPNPSTKSVADRDVERADGALPGANVEDKDEFAETDQKSVVSHQVEVRSVGLV